MKKMFLSLLLIVCLLFAGCAEKAVISENDGQTETYVNDGYAQYEKRAVRMFMADGELYYDSGEVSKMTPRCGTLDGGLKKTVKEGEIPKNDNESNFETGSDYFGYQSATDLTKEIPIDGDWVIFKKYEKNDLALDRYKYCFYIKGRMPDAAKDSEIIVLTEDKDIDFKSVIEPLFGSQYNPDENKAATNFIFVSDDDKWGIEQK